MTASNVHLSVVDANSTSTTLLNSMKKMEDEAWRRFDHLFRPVIYRWCRHLGIQESDAADICQTTLTGIFRTIGSFQRVGKGSFRAWIWLILRSKIIDYRRKRKLNCDGLKLDDLVDREPPPDPQENMILLRRALELVLHDFEPTTREGFTRVVIVGESVADVARSLGLTPNAIYLAKMRVKKRLRAEFSELIDLDNER